jgi:acetylglutamate kinase
MVAAVLGSAVLLQLTDVPGILDRDGHPLDIVSRRGLEDLVACNIRDKCKAEDEQYKGAS